MKAFYQKGALLCFLLQGFLLQAQTVTNLLDAKGQKQGLWKGYYEESKRPRYEGTFSHGKEVGIFKYFDDTKAGTVIATREFNAKDNSVYTVFYDQNSNKVSEGKMVNKLYEGQWKYYHQGGKAIMTNEFYVKGNLEGLRTVYYPSSKIAEECLYKNGKREGAYKKYTEKGVVLEEVFYTNGEIEGQAIYREPDGNIASKGLYKNGKKAGVWQFYQSGKFLKEENFNNPKNH